MNSAIKTDNKELNKLRMVFEQTPGAIFILDKEFRFEYVNPSFEHLSGYAAEELLGKTVKDLFYHEEIQESRRDVVEAMYQGKKWQGELLTHNKNGNTYWANTIAAPFKDENGDVEGYIMIQQDITEKKKLQTELQESENLYRTLIENSLEGMALTQDGRMLYVNRTFTNMLGYNLEDLVNMEPSLILAPEDRDRVMEIHYRRMKGEIETYSYNAAFIRKDGSRFVAEMNSAKVQIDGRNASLVTMRDITERNTMQQALRESEEKYKTLVENSQDGILIVRNNKVLYANDTLCKLLGYSPEGLSGDDIIHSEDIYKVAEIGNRRRNQDFSTINETFRLIAKNGDIKECDTTSTLIQFEGEWCSFFTIHDLTENKKIQLELKKSEQKYRELTEMLPLTVYELDANNKPTYINKAGRELFGLNNENSGNNAMSFFVTGDRQRMKEVLSHEQEHAKTIAQAEPSDPAEYTIQKPDGTQIPVLIYGAAIMENGKPVGSRGVIVDISERKTMENALRESEEKYKTLIENSQDGIFAIEGDKILFANQTFCRMIGYSSDELYAKSAQSLVYEGDRLKGLAISERRKSGDYSTVNELFRLVTKDNNIIEADVFSSVVDLNSRKVSLITVHDLTELKKIQTELIKSEQKYRELADFLPQTIFELDDKGVILYVNKTGMDIFGLSEMDYGKSCIDLFVQEQREILIQNLQTILAGKTNELMYEYMAQSRNGRVFPVLSYSLPVVRNGKVEGIRGMVLDISERKATEKILLESEKKYRELAEMLPQTVYELDLNANLKYLNKAGREKFGTDYETTDVSVFSIVIPEQMERMKQNFMNVSFKSIPSKGNFYKLKQINGQDFDAMISAAPMMEDGKNIGSRGIVVDLTDRIKIEQELQAAKTELEKLNSDLEKRVKDSSKRLTEARTQLINLQKENLQTQYDVLKQQVNPHFLFNSLNVLTSLIKLEPDLAEKFSEQLSKVYRYVLENKDNELVDLNTELNFLDAYIFLLNIRFIDKLKVNINIPEGRRSDKIIPLAMQLLIENAIKHNTMSKSEPLIIDIYIDKDDYLVIINNLQERPSQLVSTGIGLKNIQNRYQLLNNTTPVFEKLTEKFIAKIPLVFA